MNIFRLISIKLKWNKTVKLTAIPINNKIYGLYRNDSRFVLIMNRHDSDCKIWRHFVGQNSELNRSIFTSIIRGIIIYGSYDFGQANSTYVCQGKGLEIPSSI